MVIFKADSDSENPDTSEVNTVNEDWTGNKIIEKAKILTVTFLCNISVQIVQILFNFNFHCNNCLQKLVRISAVH